MCGLNSAKQEEVISKCHPLHTTETFLVLKYASSFDNYRDWQSTDRLADVFFKNISYRYPVCPQPDLLPFLTIKDSWHLFCWKTLKLGSYFRFFLFFSSLWTRHQPWMFSLVAHLAISCMFSAWPCFSPAEILGEPSSLPLSRAVSDHVLFNNARLS